METVTVPQQNRQRTPFTTVQQVHKNSPMTETIKEANSQ